MGGEKGECGEKRKWGGENGNGQKIRKGESRRGNWGERKANWERGRGEL